MPKSFEEELRACQRYYEKSFFASCSGTWYTSTDGAAFLSYKVPKRVTTTANTIAGSSLTNSFDQFGAGVFTPSVLNYFLGSVSGCAVAVGSTGRTIGVGISCAADIIEASAEL